MAAYFQMGHDTENLVGEVDLDNYTGIILSPINRTPSELIRHLIHFRSQGDFDVVLDPQLYFPRSRRGYLVSHPYYPNDLDTSDFSSDVSWDSIIGKLAEYAIELRVDTVASPVVHPRRWEPEYYSTCASVSERLGNMLSTNGISVLTSVMIHINHVADSEWILRLASIVSRADSAGYYVVIVSDIHPRREFSESEELTGVMRLIYELQNTGRPVIVSHCSSDMLLYKVAGAAHCATGKFFNLRRFTKSRYDDSPAGGGQVAYWFEHSLLAFLREADLLRLQRTGHQDLISTLHSDNHWAGTILDNLRSGAPTSWLGLGWRQYLSWFGKTEALITATNQGEPVLEWLQAAEENWLSLEDDSVLMEEPRNNGRWIRPWRQALAEFRRNP